jgi:predicted enzyme related to lactoylglutathione lyase
VYIGADDIDQSAASVEELGGSKIAGPFPIGPGQIAVVRDPQGGVFALYAGEYDE